MLEQKTNEDKPQDKHDSQIVFSNNFTVNVPRRYIDCCSLSPMRIPILASDGHDYELNTLIRLFASSNHRSPLVNNELLEPIFTFNFLLYSDIRFYFQDILKNNLNLLNDGKHKEALEEISELTCPLYSSDILAFLPKEIKIYGLSRLPIKNPNHNEEVKQNEEGNQLEETVISLIVSHSSQIRESRNQHRVRSNSSSTTISILPHVCTIIPVTCFVYPLAEVLSAITNNSSNLWIDYMASIFVSALMDRIMCSRDVMNRSATCDRYVATRSISTILTGLAVTALLHHLVEHFGGLETALTVFMISVGLCLLSSLLMGCKMLYSCVSDRINRSQNRYLMWSNPQENQNQNTLLNNQESQREDQNDNSLSSDQELRLQWGLSVD